MRISSGPSTGMQLADKHTKKVAKSINLSICLMEQTACPFNKVFQFRSSMDGLWNEGSGFSQDTACNEDSNGIFHVMPSRMKTRL